MADADGSRQPLEVLRNAARGGQERFLVALGDGVERPRIAGALTSEGFVLEVDSVPEGAGAPGRRVVRPRDPGSARRASCSRRRAARDPLAASRELRPFTDLVLIGDGDPTRAGQAFAREVAAVLPRAAARGRRAAARARQAAGRIPARAHARPAGAERLRAASRTSWRAAAPELGATLDALVAGGASAIRRSSCSATPSWREAAGTQRDDANPDVAVVELARRPTRSTPGWARRGRAPPGAALVVVDDAPAAGAAGERHLRRRARLPAARRAGAAGAGRGVGGGAAARRVAWA